MSGHDASTGLNAPDEALLAALRDLLGPAGVRDAADAAAWLEEPRGRWHGRAAIVARPASTDQVAAVCPLFTSPSPRY